ncbi:MAG: acyl-CoA thioesterase [Oligoflexales bacterium]
MALEGKPPNNSLVEMTELVLPQHTNALGTIFGGVVLSWVDIAAAICAQRHTLKSVVTASIDAMHFLAPIRLGWIVNIKASVNFASQTSCEIGVRISAENPLTNEYHHTASAYVTMVALDSNGRPTPIPPVEPTTTDEKKRYEAALKRRDARLALKKDLKKRNAGKH